MEYNNIYWQTLTTANNTIFQLLSAYLDTRTNNKLGPTVRIVGMINQYHQNVTTYCQFWFDRSDQPVIEKTLEHRVIWWWWRVQNAFYPYLISCALPPEFKDQIPTSISLVENKCDTATNLLNVIYDKPEEKKDFAVCVKGLDFPLEDISKRLVEWIELINRLGVDKIFFYKLQVHPNINKVLQYYEDKGMIEVTPLTLPGGQPNAPLLQHFFLRKNHAFKILNEIVPYNDCFYKNIYKYKYVVLLDTDEVIIPVQDTTWVALINRVLQKIPKRNKYTGFTIRNTHFVDNLTTSENIPNYMYMMQHIYRNEAVTRSFVKTMFKTDVVQTLHNHLPLGCLNRGACPTYYVEAEDAKLHHYRKVCSSNCMKRRKSIVMDNAIWKFKEHLVARVTETLKTLGFLQPSE